MVGAVTTSDQARAVGPTVYFNVTIGSVPVTAMVDCGSQSTIISRSLLHKIWHQLEKDGKPTPGLESPGLKMYGKDGQSGPEIVVTAWVNLLLEADGFQVVSPVFVQPHSEQECLLGMNVVPALGLQFLNAKGKPLPQHPPETLDQAPQSKVCLVQATKIPGRTSTFLKAKIDGILPSADIMVFEPAPKDLETNGLSSPEALLTPDSEGSLLIPMQNFRHSPIELDQGVELGIVEQVDP